MLFNYAEKTTPFTLSPESLDWYLANGWYRMGANIFTTHFLFFKQVPYAAMWIRVDLKNFSFSKRQRKLLRRNAKLFTTGSGKRQIDDEREELFDRYSADFDGRLSPSIAESLEDYGNEVVFNTHETTVREKVSGKLVACSYFDLGEAAAASILGIFDPLLKSFSLGYYTMLLEMQYCLDNGIRYYYPGYVVPGYRRFDYKLRLGTSEFYHVESDSWRPTEGIDLEVDNPVNRQRRALGEVSRMLNAQGHRARVQIYPLFEASLYDIWNDDYLPYPYCITLRRLPHNRLEMLVYDPREGQYLLIHCRHVLEAQVLFNSEYLDTFNDPTFHADLTAIREVIYRTANAAAMAQYITET